MGKHTKKITCGAWSQQNLLALGSEDKTISISNAEGDTIRQTSLRADPSDLSFSEMKTDERSTMGENTVRTFQPAKFYNQVVLQAKLILSKYPSRIIQ